MKNRKKLGLIFSNSRKTIFMNRTIAFFYINDDNWTGGQDYVVNAINALNFLDITKQPKVEILVDEKIELLKLKKRITYSNYKIYKIRTHKNIFIKYCA